MNRKSLPLIIGIIFLVIAGYLVIKNHNSYADLRITYGENIQGVNTKIADDDNTYEVNSTSDIRLKKGKYSVQTSEPSESSDYETLSFELEIKDGENKIDINPSYTKEKLQTLLSGQEANIQSVITKGINLGSEYRLVSGELLIHGEWYGTTIVPNISDSELERNYFDVYKVVVKKSGDSWILATDTPELVLTKVLYPDIPTNVLSKANQLYYDDTE